jgi:hypothetical protein
MENKFQTATPDNKRAGAEDDKALDYWSNEFGISKEELLEAVKAGATTTEAVEEYVKKVEFTT